MMMYSMMRSFALCRPHNSQFQFQYQTKKRKKLTPRQKKDAKSAPSTPQQTAPHSPTLEIRPSQSKRGSLFNTNQITQLTNLSRPLVRPTRPQKPSKNPEICKNSIQKDVRTHTVKQILGLVTVTSRTNYYYFMQHPPGERHFFHGSGAARRRQHTSLKIYLTPQKI